MADETMHSPPEREIPPPGRLDSRGEGRRSQKEDPLARTLHGLNNALHGMSLRLVLLRNDPDCMAKHAATVEALRRGIHAAAEEIDRLEELLAAQKK